MHMYHQLLKILAQPFVRLCFLRRTGAELVPERHNDFHGLGFRSLDKALHLPTHHQLCSMQLLQGELNLRCPQIQPATRGTGGPCSQDHRGRVHQTSLHSEPCSATMRVSVSSMRSRFQPM